jgi:hypothetical protein
MSSENKQPTGPQAGDRIYAEGMTPVPASERDMQALRDQMARDIENKLANPPASDGPVRIEFDEVRSLPIHDPIERRAIALRMALDAKFDDSAFSTGPNTLVAAAKRFERYMRTGE